MRRPSHPKVAPPYTPCTFDKTHPSRRRSSSYPFSYSKLYDKVLTLSNMDITSNPVSSIAETSTTTEKTVASKRPGGFRSGKNHPSKKRVIELASMKDKKRKSHRASEEKRTKANQKKRKKEITPGERIQTLEEEVRRYQQVHTKQQKKTTKQNTRRTQVLAELSGLRTGGTTSPTTSTLELLGPVRLSQQLWLAVLRLASKVATEIVTR